MNATQKVPLRDPEYKNTIFNIQVWDTQGVMPTHFLEHMGNDDELALVRAWCDIVEWLRHKHGFNPKIHRCDVYNPYAMLEHRAVEGIDFVIIKQSLYIRADKLQPGDVINRIHMIEWASEWNGLTFTSHYRISIYHTVTADDQFAPLYYKSIVGGPRWDAFQSNPLEVAEYHKFTNQWRWKE